MRWDVARAKPVDEYKLHVFLDAVSWPNGQDIAPETMYAAITGEPLPDWMVAEKSGPGVSAGTQK